MSGAPTIDVPCVMPVRSPKLNQSNQPQVLLVSGTAPGEPGVGGVILRDLVQIVGFENCHVCWLNPYRDGRTTYIDGLSTTSHQRRYETGWRPLPGIAGETISRAAMFASRQPLIAKIAAEVKGQIERFKPSFLLCVLDSGLTIQVLRRLIQTLSIPIRTIVWDDVDTVCQEGVLDRWTRSAIQRDFAAVLQRSERVAVICENMQVSYQQKYRINSSIIRHGMPEVDDSLVRQDESDHVLRIGFAGSITTPDCMQSLIGTLDQLQWRSEGRNICLRMLGARFQLGTVSRQWIEYFGWRDVHETRDLLGQCDLLYLPQSFLPQLRHLSELSFPTKLSTYVAAGRPILLQAPSYGSLTNFWQHYPLGPVAGSLDQQALKSALLTGLESSPSQREGWALASRSAHRDALSVELFQNGVRRLLGVDESK